MLSKLKISKIFQENLILYTAIISGLFCIILLGERFLLDNFDALGQHIAPETEWNADRLAMAFFWQYKAIPAWADTVDEFGKFYLHYLPDFTRKIEVPELSGLIVYTKEIKN